MRTTPRAINVTLIVVVICLFAPSIVQALSNRWSVRGLALGADYTKKASDSSVSGTSYLDLSGGPGFQLGVEFRPRSRAGWELSAGELTFDATSKVGRVVPISFDPLVLEERITVVDTGELVVRPITLGVLIHSSTARAFSVYGGPLIGVALFDVNVDGGERDPELLYGAKVGADVRLGRGAWAAGVEARYVEIAHDTHEHDLFRDLELTTLGVGLVYHIGGSAR